MEEEEEEEKAIARGKSKLRENQVVLMAEVRREDPGVGCEASSRCFLGSLQLSSL